MPEPTPALLQIIADAYPDAEGFIEEDFDNGVLQAQMVPKSGVQAFSPPVQVQVGTRIAVRPGLQPVNPTIGTLAVFAMFVPFIKRVDQWIVESNIERETKSLLLAIGNTFKGISTDILERPDPEPEHKPKKLPLRQKKKQKHKESRIRIYGYSRKLSGSNTIRPQSRPF